MNHFALTIEDYTRLARRYIGPEQVRLNDIYRVDDVEGAEKIGRRFSGSEGPRYCGLIIPNYRIGALNPRSYRLRRDFPDLVSRTDGPGFKEKGKYLWHLGSRSVFYYPFGNKPEWMLDISIPAFIIEGEFKAIALKRVLDEFESKALVIGIYGAHNWKGKTTTGSSETGPVNDFDDFAWQGREIIICRDANFRTNDSVRAGMRDLSLHTGLLGAIPYFADTPELEGVNGLDDLAGLHNAGAVLDVIAARHRAIKPTIKPQTSEERQSRKDAFRKMIRERAAKEDEYTATRRRATSADFAALSVITAELDFKDKSKVALQALIAKSDGHASFDWKYEELYSLLRKHDPELFQKTKGRLSKKAQSKINQIVRGYLNALDGDQKRTGIWLAQTERGTRRWDEHGKEVFSRSKTFLPILSYLEEIDELAKANRSYASRSRQIRAAEARALVGRLTKYKPPQRTRLTPRQEIELTLKRAAGNINSVINQMRALEYEDWAIQQDFKRYLPTEFFEIIFLKVGDTPEKGQVADSQTDIEKQNVDNLHFWASEQEPDSIPIEEDKKVSNLVNYQAGDPTPLESDFGTSNGAQPGPALWPNIDSDEPVTVRDDACVRLDGRGYALIEESALETPFDEIAGESPTMAGPLDPLIRAIIEDEAESEKYKV